MDVEHQAAAKAVVQLCMAIIEAVKEADGMGLPSGPMYAALMGKVSLEEYYKLIGLCKATGLIEERGHCFYYIGPR